MSFDFVYSTLSNLSDWVVAAAQGGGAEGAPGGGLQQLLLMGGIMFVMLWLIVLRPQRKEKQRRQELLNAMKKGDKVVSIGGIHGKVADVDNNQGIVTVEIAPKTIMKFSKAAIQTVNPKGGAEAPQDNTKEDEKK